MRRYVIVVAVAAAAAGAGCRALGRQTFTEPVVTFRDVNIKGLGLNGGSLEVVLSVYNPNNYRLDATRLNYRLLVDSVPLGSGTTDSRFTLRSKDSTLVPLPLDFKWSGLNRAGRDLLNTGTVNYRVVGDITVGSPVGSLTIPYDRQGRFTTLGGTERESDAARARGGRTNKGRG